MDVVVMVFDLMLVHNFSCQMVNGGGGGCYNNTTITVDAKYSINITKSRKKVCLSLHYNGSNSF